MALQNRVRELRATVFKGEVSQKQLAERAGIDPSTLSDIENNRKSPSMETGLALARLFGCSVEDLFLPSATHDDCVDSPRADVPAGRAAPSVANGPSTPRTGEPSVAGFVEPRSPGDRTADELAVAKES